MRRSPLAALLICGLLALSGCGVVKDAARRVLGDGFAGLLGHETGSEAAEEAGEAPGPLSIAADEDAAGAVAADDEGSGESGFYKIVEPNGTVRFVSNLSQLPAERRSQAERLAMAPTKVPGSPHRAAPRREAGQVAAAAQAPPAKPAPVRASGGHEVVIYTTTWCGWCKKTIAWLDSKGVDYVNKDVESDPDAAAEMRGHVGGDSGVPVVVIDGEVIRGFSAAKMESLLRI